MAKKSKKEEKHCANCREEMETDVIKVEFGYGSILDGEVIHFCSDKCLREWCEDNIDMPHSTNSFEDEETTPWDDLANE